MNGIGVNMNNTSLGLDEKIEAALCYVFGFLTGIVFFVIEKDNKFVKFHAIQSIVVFFALFIVNMVINMMYAIPYITWFVATINGVVMIVQFLLWIILMYKAYTGEKFKLPIVGDIAEKNSR